MKLANASILSDGLMWDRSPISDQILKLQRVKQGKLLHMCSLSQLLTINYWTWYIGETKHRRQTQVNKLSYILNNDIEYILFICFFLLVEFCTTRKKKRRRKKKKVRITLGVTNQAIEFSFNCGKSIQY